MQKSEEELMREQTVAILKELTKDEQDILWRVIKAERDKLHMKTPRGINEDIWKAVMEIIQ